MDASRLQAIGFDMGGTSTDVSRFAGTYEHVFETTTAGECFHEKLWEQVAVMAPHIL